MDTEEETRDESSAPPQRPAVTLPQRRPSVTLHQRISENGQGESSDGASNGMERRDSLGDTKAFYNVRPVSPASQRDPHSRISGLRSSISRPDSRISSISRATSPDNAGLPRSPSRIAPPLPTPRAFLTPKKPEAVIRLEKRKKARASGFSASNSDIRSDSLREFARETPTEGGPSRMTQRSSEFGLSPEPPISLDAALFAQTPGPLSAPPLPSHTHINGVNHSGDDYIPAASGMNSLIRGSIPDMSTPPHIHRDLSSDNLVANGTTSTNRGDKSDKPYDRPESKHRSFSKSHPSQPSSTAKHGIRRYKLFENKQTTWLFGGRMMTGGDNPVSVLTTLVIILGLSGVWVGTTGVWLWQHGTEYGLAKGGGIAVVIIFVYLFGLVISSLMAAGLRDPGIIPRNLDPDPPLSQVESWWEADNREMLVKNGKVTVKYCETCKTYRPPRSSHCRLCGNCVDGIDHHCSYIHTCVGKRNYLAFLTLLVSSVRIRDMAFADNQAISDIYIIVFSAIHFALLCHHDRISFGAALRESPGAAVSFLLGIMVLPAALFLLWYHVILVMYNLTTVEQIRASASTNLFKARKRPDNPFAEESIMSNIILASIGRPQFPSWVNASAWEKEDTRSVNPALLRDLRQKREYL